MPPNDDPHYTTCDSEARDLDPQAEAKDDLPPGTMIGQYRLLEKLGAGGMGQVFKAVHDTMQRIVALKVMAPQLVADERAKKRFLREVRSAARLQHPNIVMAYDAAEAGNRCFLVMEYVEARDAGILTRDLGPAPVETACEIIRQAALGLHHAYEMGVVHRDIKPGNILVGWKRPPNSGQTNSGTPIAWPREPIVKILDLGLARLAEGEAADGTPLAAATPLTREGFVVGTPEFMSPEQATNSSNLDIRSDIYSLGCTLYCLLTGEPPFVGRSLVEVMVQHLQMQPQPVTVRRGDVPTGLSEALGRMLCKKPEQRYQTPAEVAEALEPFCGRAATSGTKEPSPLTAPPPVASPGPRTPISPTIPARLKPNIPDPPDTALMPKDQTPAAPIPAAVAPPPARPLPAPQPLPRQRGFFERLGRTVFGCAGLLFVVLGSMYVGLNYWPGPTDDTAPVPSEPGPLGMTLVTVPPGELEQPTFSRTPHVNIDRAFQIATTEITREQFQEFVQDAKVEIPPGAEVHDEKGSMKGFKDSVSWKNRFPVDFKELPVSCVTFDDAIQFCNWLTLKSGASVDDYCYTQDGKGGWTCRFERRGFRLPREAEWEYAARNGRRIPAPEALEPYAILRFGNDRPGPDSVRGKRMHNGHEIFDMWGNVWEWVWDHPPNAPGERIVRGGGWADSSAPFARPENTGKPLPAERRYDDVGFRVVRTIPPVVR